jgi:predicted enzyme related to lactoylglutathione lyase
VAVPVTDLDAAVTFFVDVLGFDKRADARVGERRWIEVAPAGAETVIVPYTWYEHHDDRVGGFTRIVLHCDDLDATCRDLRERGVAFDREPAETGQGYAQFLDPFGNVYVLTGVA